MVVAQEVKPSWRKLGNRRHGPKEDLGTLISKSSTQTPVSLLPSHHEVNSPPQHTGTLPQQGPNAVRSSDNGQRSLETSAKGNRSSITWPQTFVTGTENWQSGTTKQCLYDNVKREEKITVHEFPARGMFSIVLALQLALWQEFCFISFVSFFSGNPKAGRAKCPVHSHSSLSYLTSILLKLAQTFPSFSQESHFCFNFSVYPESVSGLSTARETPSKLAVSTSLMNSRVPQMLKPYSPFKHAVPKPHIY